jgi:HK97 family phage major capsid protein
VYKQSLTDRRAMLGRLTLELTNKRAALTEGELLKLKSLRAEMDALESEIGFDQNRKYRDAFVRGLRFGFSEPGLAREDLEIIHSVNALRREGESRSLNAGVLAGGDDATIARSVNSMRREAEARDMQVGPDGGAYPGASLTGGVFVPLEMTDAITSALRDYGPMYRLATIFDGESGAQRAYPVENDATISGERLSEDEAASTADIADINQVMLSSYRYSSKVIKISTSLVQDFGFPIEEYLAERFAIRIARAANADFTVGTGSANQQPQGFIGAATSAGVAVGANANDGVSGADTLGTIDFASLEASVDPAYRRNAVWQMHPNTLQKLRAQLDREGRPVFGGLQNSADGVDRILNYKVVTSPDVPQIPIGPNSPQVSAVTLAFGDFSKYIIRRAPPLLRVLKQRFVDQGMMGYLLWWRQDGNLIDGGGGAIKTLSNVY